MHRHMYMSLDYNAELTQWAQEDYFFSNVHKMQLPYTTVSICYIYILFIYFSLNKSEDPVTD